MEILRCTLIIKGLDGGKTAFVVLCCLTVSWRRSSKAQSAGHQRRRVGLGLKLHDNGAARFEFASSHLLHSGRILQEWLCLKFWKAELQRLQFVRFNQKHLRADLYNNLQDAISAGDVDPTRLGQRCMPAFSRHHSQVRRGICGDNP